MRRQKGKEGRQENVHKNEVTLISFNNNYKIIPPTLTECLSGVRLCAWGAPRRIRDEPHSTKNHTGGSGIGPRCVGESQPEIDTCSIRIHCGRSFFINSHCFICSALKSYHFCSTPTPSNKIKLISWCHLKIYLCLFSL